MGMLLGLVAAGVDRVLGVGEDMALSNEEDVMCILLHFQVP